MDLPVVLEVTRERESELISPGDVMRSGSSGGGRWNHSTSE